MSVESPARSIMNTMRSMFMDGIDLYCWEESLKTGKELFNKIQEETNTWENILIATGGYLKQETHISDNCSTVTV
jgi:hypothetical protein